MDNDYTNNNDSVETGNEFNAEEKNSVANEVVPNNKAQNEPIGDASTAYSEQGAPGFQNPPMMDRKPDMFDAPHGFAPRPGSPRPPFPPQMNGEGNMNGQSNPDSFQQNSEGGIRTTYVNRPSFSQGQNGSETYHFAGFGPNGQPSFTENGSPINDSSPKETKKEKKKGIGAGTVAFLLVLCIILSAGFGFGGAFAYSKLNGSSASSGKGTVTVNYATDTSSKEKKSSDGTVAGAASIAKDSVVEITTESLTTSSFFGQYITSGAGSGVIIDGDNGYIITCAHVVEDATSITVTLSNGDQHEAKLVGSDTQTDIAVISIDATGLTAANIGNSDNLVVGETAIAIGNPLGTLGGTVSSGIISALDREITIDGQKFNLLQIDTSINPGNSGGGLFDIDGNLIGIVNAKSSGYGDTSTTIEGLGFAIPISKAIGIAEQLTKQGYVGGRVRLGIYYYEVTTETSSYSLYQSGNGDLANYITDYGIYFLEYSKGQSGDLMYGDRIVAIDGTSISSVSDITSLLEEYSVGDTVKVTVSRLNSDRRRSQMVDVDVTLIEYIPETTTDTQDK